MNVDELNNQYQKVPIELKNMKRWVCFKVIKNGNKTDKIPVNALNGKNAKSDDSLTWTTFRLAIMGCVKHKCNGIGFMLGNGIFGVDLDNHINPKTNELELEKEKFDEIAKDFIDGLNSYSEWSWSGNGIHIICAGKLPGTRRKTTCVEMYEKGRFFAFTGNVINNKPVEVREEEIKPLYDKYMPKEQETKEFVMPNDRELIDLGIDEIINKAIENPKNGEMFSALFYGDIDEAYRISNGSWKDGSHSSADMALCNLLAFWCNCDKDKMDLIFRMSGLYREKWDEKRGSDTYGNITIDKAINNCSSRYTKAIDKGPKITYSHKRKEEIEYEEDEETGEVIERIKNKDNVAMNIASNGEPIFRIKTVYKRFPCNDTGNAEKFYAFFGDLFKYNTTDKIFMFWTGKTWIRDEKNIIRKYANKFIEICKTDLKNLEDELESDRNQGKDIKLNEEYIKAYKKNLDRISNKAGKDAMLSEFQALKDIAVTSDEFNKDDYLLNTDSGIVDLKTSQIYPFNPELMLSKNTNIKVSYEEPTVWINFLHGIFERGNAQETEEIIECLQKALGYSLSGSTKETCMFLCYGNGSNGKTTFQEIVNYIMGEYGDNVDSSVLMQQKNQASNSFTIAKLKDARYVETDETDEGERLSEGVVKRMTGGGQMSAAFKYANEFSFMPKFKIWLATNNKPIIRGTDLGIWRRIFIFPFVHTFTEEEKDKDLPEKLRAEADKILGWCIKGFKIYNELKTIKKPQCIEDETKEYRDDMDTIGRFLNSECTIVKDALCNCKEAFKSYKEWCFDINILCQSEFRFSKELVKKGYKIITHNNKKCYQGFMVPIKY